MSRVLLLTALLFFTAPYLLLPSTLSNQHLVISVDDDTGRLNMATRYSLEPAEGAEQGNLLFYDQPPSSYTLIYVDDDLFVFGGDRGSFSKRPVIIGNYIEAVWENEFIKVTQVVQFVQREKTDVEDGVLLRYEIENRMPGNVEIGIRVLHDSFLGEEGPIHFILADGTGLEYETEFDSPSLPRSWVSRGQNGQEACLRGVVAGRLATPPRKLVFANYRSLLQQPAQYKIMKNHRFQNLPYSRNDSAVALYFGPTLLEFGGQVEFTTILGLCGEGEYVLGGHEAVFQEKTATPPPILVPAAAAQREEIELLLKQIGDIERLRISMEQINALIAELNKALEGGDAMISEERLAEIRKVLQDMTEQ